MLKRLIIFTLLSLFSSSLIIAQDAPQPAQNPLAEEDDRNGMWVPTNVTDLRLVSQDWWLKFRKTNQQLYNFVGESAEFRAYLFVCKRHDLNVGMVGINALSNRNLQQILLALFKEAEYGILEAHTKVQQAEIMADIASDAYSFEYGYRIARQTAIISVSGKTTNNYCQQVEDLHFKKYIALRATAKRQIEQLQR